MNWAPLWDYTTLIISHPFCSGEGEKEREGRDASAHFLFLFLSLSQGCVGKKKQDGCHFQIWAQKKAIIMMAR